MQVLEDGGPQLHHPLQVGVQAVGGEQEALLHVLQVVRVNNHVAGRAEAPCRQLNLCIQILHFNYVDNLILGSPDRQYLGLR